ncbi:PAS domain S-box protein [Methylocystis sp. MJC1]|uniref:PAS domain S-box protein n=1 Tax=Methylocystis sp. MJC1 TaxID=2654282 RepID=UPI001FED5FEF|nr:PAS domain S-box protein [Methylocystis sp. MJC1]KAF2992817.1 Sensor protein FixL [Methylocystis sp. MJC1]UZX13211.1 PAS domain S-box protein [Methylocystis sp. MJC1]
MEEKPLTHLLLETSNEAACLMDPSGLVLALNSRAEQMTGFKEGELIGRPFPGKPKAAMGNAKEAPLAWLVAPARQWFDMRIKRKDEKEIDASCEIYRLGTKSLAGILLKLRTEGAEGAALEDMKIKLQAIFGGMADGFVVIDEFGKIEFFSTGAEKLFGYGAEEVMGANVKLLMPSPYKDEHDGYLAAYRETGVRKIIGSGREVSGRRKDGVVFPMYLSVGEIWLEGRRHFVGVTHDLTKTKRAESRLWMLTAAIEQSPVAVMISDTHGVIEYVNDYFAKLTGYSEAEVIGQNPRILHSAGTPRDQHQRLWRTIEAGAEWRGEIQDQRKDGALYWAYEIIAPLRDEEGQIRHYLAIQQDVTEQRRDKEALAESEERFRKVAEMVGEWLWEQDADGRYTYSSDAVRDILGLEPEEILGKCYLDLLQDDANPAAPRQPTPPTPFRRIVNCYRRQDGRRVFTESSGAPILNGKGRLVKWRGVDRDITERMEYEDALRVRNRAMEAVHVGIVICDARVEGNPNIYVNPALAEMTGYTQDELLQGGGMRLLQGPGTDPAAIAKIRQALQTGRGCEVTLRNYRKNGEAFWNELLISPVPDEAGEITHYIGVQTDVTEKRRAEESRRDLEIAKQIQLSLLPDKPLRLPNAEIAGICLPATHVGGDYFDFFESGENVDFVVADVSGHSVGAALIMTEVRSMVRAQSRRPASAHPAHMLRELNELLYEDLDRSELFITMFFCRYESTTRRLKYASAGHNPGLLLRSGQQNCMELDSDGLVLGAKRMVDFEERSVLLSQGDKLLFYTDGVIEAQDSSGDFFGTERLCRRFSANRRFAPEVIAQKLLREVKDFCAPSAMGDDAALVVLEVR